MAKSSGSTTTTQQPVGVNRRTLLRTGAHAAWAIPAVQIVTQSPALAATNGALVAQVVSQGWAAGTDFFDVTVRVTNNTATATKALRVTLTATKPGNKSWSGASAIQSGAWVVTASSAANGGNQSGLLTVQLQAGAQLAGDSATQEFTVRLTGSSQARGQSTTVNVQAFA